MTADGTTPRPWWRRIAWDRADAVLLIASVAAFLVLSSRYWAYTMDDSFITARYANHLAQGHGLAWNPGEDLVEGATSIAWVLVMAGTLKLGLPLMGTVNVLSMVSVLAVAVLLYAHGRALGKDRRLLGLVLVGLLWNPGVAFHATTGMETIVALAAVFATAWFGIRVMDGAARRDRILLLIAAFATLLLRPDTAVFIAALYVGILWVWLRRPDAPLRAGAAEFAALNLLPGIAYMAWRMQYFGHLLPNPFYVKTDNFRLSLVTFEVGSTLLIAAAGLLYLLALQRVRVTNRTDAARSIVLVVAAGVFLASTFQAAPVMAFLGRYQTPMLGALFLAAVLVMPDGVNRLRLPFGASGRLGTVLLAALAAWTPAAGIVLADDAWDTFHSTDREDAGRAFAALGLSDVRLYTGEAGALPYFTDWPTTDHHGLNDERIAHGAKREDVLAEDRPDLVMLHQSQNNLAAGGRPAGVFDWMAANDYWLISIDPDTRAHPVYHLYLVRNDSPHRDLLVCTTLDFEDQPQGRTDRMDAFDYPAKIDAESEMCP